MVLKGASIILLLTLVQYVLSDFNLTIVHITDLHSHWFEFDDNKGECSEEESKQGKCFGGFPRLISFVRDIRKREKNVLVLSSGEFFLGRSLHALHGWKPAHALLPRLELDAMSLSNHDFDSGMFELSAFLYSMKFPVLTANMWARKTSYIYSRVNKSAVIEVGGQRVGIVGYIHRQALKKSKHAVSVLFLPEIPALQDEVRRLEDEEGVDKIIALGHAGYYTDLKIAREVKGVDIVMGGDSDIMLFDPGDDESSRIGNIHGNYPRIHEHESDDPSLANRTLVLHIPQHGKYVGVLRATFDDRGKIIHESGEPVLLDSSIPQDQGTLEFMNYAKGALEKVHEHSRLPENAEVLAKVTGWLEGEPRSCRMRECTLGNLVADAFLHEFTFHYRNGSESRNLVEHWGPIDAVVMNSGNIMHSIEAGDITIQDVLRAVSLGDFIQRVYMSGQEVMDMMEHSVRHYDPWGVTPTGAFLQMAGLRVEYDLKQAPGRRVRSLQIRCRDCYRSNSTETYNSLKPYKTYVIGMPSFMMHGGDGFQEFEERDKYDFGQFDAEVFVEYLRRVFLVEPTLDGRIQFYEPNITKSETVTVGTEAAVTPLTDSPLRDLHVTDNLKNLTDNAAVTLVSERHDKKGTATGDMGDKGNFPVTPTDVGEQNKQSQAFTSSASANDMATQSVQTNASKREDKSSLYHGKHFDEVGNETNEDPKTLDALYKNSKDAHKSWKKDPNKEESKRTEKNEHLSLNASDVEAERSPSTVLSVRSSLKDSSNVTSLLPPVAGNETYEDVRNNRQLAESTNASKDDSSDNRVNNLPVTADRGSINHTGLETTAMSIPAEQSHFINHFESYMNNILKTHSPKNRSKDSDKSANESSYHKKADEKHAHKDLQKLLNQTVGNFSKETKETFLMELAKLFATDQQPSKADGVEGNGSVLKKLPEFLQNVWQNLSLF